MIEMYLLETLDAVVRCGTLQAASEHLHITQPSISRSLKKLENILGVELFEHKANRLVLNEYGKIAADYARRILDSQDEMILRISALERSRHTISLGSCAPGPVMEMPSLLSSLYPEQTISTEIRNEETLLSGLTQGGYQMVILIHKPENPGLHCVPCGSERLYFSLPKGHSLAGHKNLSFADMNGESFLMASDVGIWEKVVHLKMPDSRFHLQGDLMNLREVVRSSTMPSFATDLTIRLFGHDADRVYLPISDPEAEIPYWCCCLTGNENRYRDWFHALDRRYNHLLFRG